MNFCNLAHGLQSEGHGILAHLLLTVLSVVFGSQAHCHTTFRTEFYYKLHAALPSGNAASAAQPSQFNLRCMMLSGKHSACRRYIVHRNGAVLFPFHAHTHDASHVRLSMMVFSAAGMCAGRLRTAAHPLEEHYALAICWTSPCMQLFWPVHASSRAISASPRAVQSHLLCNHLYHSLLLHQPQVSLSMRSSENTRYLIWGF